jgi:hypothetical protein
MPSGRSQRFSRHPHARTDDGSGINRFPERYVANHSRNEFRFEDVEDEAWIVAAELANKQHCERETSDPLSLLIREVPVVSTRGLQRIQESRDNVWSELVEVQP